MMIQERGSTREEIKLRRGTRGKDEIEERKWMRRGGDNDTHEGKWRWRGGDNEKDDQEKWRWRGRDNESGRWKEGEKGVNWKVE